jgi:predicted phage tail protein
MKVVKVYGALRKRLGQCRFEFVAETPAQALRALITNFPGLDRWLIDSEKDGVAYRVTVGKEKIGQEDATGLFLPWSERQVFSITPVLTGAGGGGLGQILVGVGLVAAAIVLGPAVGGFLGLGITGAIGGTVATGIGLVGTGLVLSGVATLLSPAPSLTGVGSIGIRDEAAARLESFSFSGLVNTTKQGLPVPIAYGRVFTGSAVVSAGLDTNDI